MNMAKKKVPLSKTHPKLAKEADGWDPKTVTSGSHSKVKWKCKLGHQWESAVKTRALGGNNCPVCSGHTVIPNFNDLNSKYPEIAKLAYGWDPKTVTPKSGKKVSWKCKSGHITQVRVASKVDSGGSCSVCSGHKVSVGFNDLDSTHPEIAKEADGWDPTKINSGAHRKLTWRCPRGHSYSANVGTRTGGNQSGCPICAGKQVLTGYNDLKFKFPEIADQAYGWDPTRISSGSSKKLKWKCKENHIWSSTVSHRTGAHKSARVDVHPAVSTDSILMLKVFCISSNILIGKCCKLELLIFQTID
jgi:hypothetical protein